MTRFSSQALDELLGTGIRQLDITAAERALAVARYGAVARSLAEHWNTDPHDGLVYSQGSMRLGTITRNFHQNDEIDIDLVARRDQPKESTTQAELKADTGLGLEKFVLGQPEGSPALEPGKRCWTLHYPGFHLDVLPALPNLAAPSESAIIITDTEVLRWQFSNPVAYADWFHDVMAQEIEDRLKVIAKRMSIDEVPDWQVKTTLQQTVQALKRHRDIFFTDRLDQRPASIIITTLAAHAYRGGGDLYEVLDNITDRMPSFVQLDGNRYVVANPVESEENFTDRWNGKPERAAAFFEWIEQAKADFAGLSRTGGGLDTVIRKMADVLGDGPARNASQGLSGGIVEARRQGQLTYGAGTGTLGAVAATGTRRITRDHDFHGHHGARP